MFAFFGQSTGVWTSCYSWTMAGHHVIAGQDAAKATVGDVSSSVQFYCYRRDVIKLEICKDVSRCVRFEL